MNNTTIHVQDVTTALFYDGQFLIMIDSEKIECSSSVNNGTAPDQFTGCVRGLYDSFSASHAGGAAVEQPDTFKWRDNDPCCGWNVTGIPITGQWQSLEDSIDIQFNGSIGDQFMGEGDLNMIWNFTTNASSTVTTVKDVTGDSPITPVMAWVDRTSWLAWLSRSRPATDSSDGRHRSRAAQPLGDARRMIG